MPGFLPTSAPSRFISIKKESVPTPFSCDPVSILTKKTPNGIECIFPNKVKYTIRNGTNIGIFSAPGTQPDIEKIPLYGFVIAAVLQQNELFILHGSTISINNKAVIIIGAKTFGKSTLAANLVSRGHKLISDDITAISIHNDKIFALPGIPVLKLWPKAVKKSGLQPFKSRKLYKATEKHICFLEENEFQNQATEIKDIIILDDMYEQEVLNKITSLPQRILSLSDHHYFSRYEDLFTKKEKESTFLKIAELAKSKIGISRLVRPYNLDRIHHSSEIIEKKTGCS